MSVSWYDVLGLDREAGTDEIRAAWKASIADLDPTDRRFKVYNEAAGVLLDPAKRSAYDASLPPEESEDEAAEVLAPEDLDDSLEDEAVVVGDDKLDVGSADDVDPDVDADREVEDADDSDEDDQPASEDDDETAAGAPAGSEPGERRGVSSRILALLAVLTLLVAGAAAVLHVTNENPDDVEKQMSQARRAAESAVPKVIAYDYKFPERAHDQAMRVLTGELKKEYDDVWTDAVEPNLAKSKATLSSQVIASGLVRSSADGDRVDVLTVMQVHAVNSEGTQDAVVSLTATMVNRDGTWLITELDGWDAGLAEEPAQDEPSTSPSGSASPSPSASESVR